MLNSIYTYVRTRNHNIPNHVHNNYEFVYFFNGKGTLTYDKNIFHFSQGSYYIMKPQVVHSEQYDTPATSLVTCFTLTENFPINIVTNNNALLDISSFVNQITTELDAKQFGQKLIIDAVMQEIITLILRKHNKISPNLTQPLINSIKYIDEYYMTNIKIDDLAYNCGYSTDHYRVLFKKFTDKTPKEYILEKRLALSKQLLKETSLSLTEIQVQCGFEYYSQFSMFFKSATTMTPKEYRKKYNITTPVHLPKNIDKTLLKNTLH